MNLNCTELSMSPGCVQMDTTMATVFQTVNFFVLDALGPYFDVFVDIGSNCGIFLDRLDHALEHFILAFEPNPDLQDVLSEKISRGELFNTALSNKKAVGHLNVYKDNTTSSLLERDDLMPHFTRHSKCVEIKIDILDSYISLIQKYTSKGCFIKIDAEGAEYSILQGACSVLQELPCVFLMFEYSMAWRQSGYTLKEAFHFLDRLGFSIYRITPFGLEEMRFYTPQMDSSDYCNYFATNNVSVLSGVFRCDDIPSSTHVLNKIYLYPSNADHKSSCLAFIDDDD